MLAAGKGTRMAHPDLPKPLVPVAGKPMLSRVLDKFAAAGCTRAVLVIGYRGEMIRTEYGSEYAGMQIDYAEQEVQRGTADAITCALPLLGDEEAVLQTFADVFSTASLYAQLAAAWQVRDVVALSTVVRGNPSVGALVSFDNDLAMTAFTEKPPGVTSGWADGGTYVLSQEALEAMAHVSESERHEKEIATALRHLLELGRPVGVEKYDGAWIDLGTPELLAEAETRYAELMD